MTTVNIFEQAVRQKLRIKSGLGLLAVEQLWDLPLKSTTKPENSLYGIANALNKQLKQTDDIDALFEIAPAKDQSIQLSFDIVKHIITIRLDENKAENERRTLLEQRKVLDQAIIEKRNEQLLTGSVEELEAKRAELEAKLKK